MNVVFKEGKKGQGGRGGGGGRGGRGGGNKTMNNNTNTAPQKKEQSTVSLVMCQCLGTRHPHVTNCTTCGYILCQYEVEKQQSSQTDLFTCPHCSNLCGTLLTANDLQRQGHADESTIAAYTLKDTLLQYDKEHAKRTVVHDAQADYYVSGAWLSEEERKALELKEKKRLEAKKRSNHQHRVNIRFDIAGKKIVEYKGEEEEEEAEKPHDEDQGFVICKPGLDELDTEYAFVEGEEQPPQHIYENSELEYGSSKAAEIYRHMKKRYVETCPFLLTFI